jgi:hypothetical protein
VNSPRRREVAQRYRALVVAAAARLEPGAVPAVLTATLVHTEGPKHDSWRARHHTKGTRNDRPESRTRNAGE